MSTRTTPKPPPPTSYMAEVWAWCIANPDLFAWDPELPS